MKTLKLTPSQQGSLDCLCGIYSVVNAVSYLYHGKPNRRALSYALIVAYSEQWELIDLLHEGMHPVQMRSLLKSVLKTGFYHSRYPIRVTNEFKKSAKLSIAHALDLMQSFLVKARPIRSRVILISTKEHWTVVYHIDATYLHLFDSNGRSQYNRRHLSFKSGIRKQVLLRSGIFFIQRAKESR